MRQNTFADFILPSVGLITIIMLVLFSIVIAVDFVRENHRMNKKMCEYFEKLEATSDS